MWSFTLSIFSKSNKFQNYLNQVCKNKNKKKKQNEKSNIYWLINIKLSLINKKRYKQTGEYIHTICTRMYVYILVHNCKWMVFLTFVYKNFKTSSYVCICTHIFCKNLLKKKIKIKLKKKQKQTKKVNEVVIENKQNIDRQRLQ